MLKDLRKTDKRTINSTLQSVKREILLQASASPDAMGATTELKTRLNEVTKEYRPWLKARDHPNIAIAGDSGYLKNGQNQ